ncbi:MAG: 3'-5' exonuclease, partial [Bacteroidota bacterium]
RNDHLIKPDGFTISHKAASIHGITTVRAKEEGVDLRPVLDEFAGQMEKATYLVAHNMSFDEKIIGAEFLRNDMPNHIPSKQKICTMKGMTDYVAIPGNYGYKWPKLGELHRKLFGRGFKEAHNAAADIDATAKCFWEARRLGVL